MSFVTTNTLGASRTNYLNGSNPNVTRRTLGASQQLTFGLTATTNPTTVDPIVATVHQRVLEQLGAGGFKAVGRAFRLSSATASASGEPPARLTPEDVRSGFQDCGIDMSTSDLRRLFSLADKQNEGSVAVDAFMRVLRGPLPRARAKIVEDAWAKVDPSGSGAAPIDALLAAYCAKLHPIVTKGEATAEEVMAAFTDTFSGSMGSEDGNVSKEEFLDYFAGLSDATDSHDYFNLIVRETWRIGQPNNFNKTDADHHRYTVDQFQSSAYRGCTGAFPPPEAADDVGAKRQPRFASMISNNLVPYPMHKLGGCPPNAGSGAYLGASVRAHKVNTKDIAEKVADPTLDFEKSSTGKVPGMVTSRGFIDHTTTTATMHGEFSDEVMDTFHGGKARERAAEADRAALQSTPFATADPNHWARSSDAYGDYRKVDRSEFTSTNAAPRLAHGEANRLKTRRMMEAGRDVDMAALRERRDEISRAALPQGYSAPSGAMLTTMKDHFAGYDPELGQESNDRWASVPLQHRHQVATEAEREAYAAQQQRFAARHEGDFNTEKADQHRDLSGEADTSRQYDVKGAFSIRNGVRCIRETVHRPRDVTSDLSGTLTRNTIVPGQFTAMSDKPLHTPHQL